MMVSNETIEERLDEGHLNILDAMGDSKISPLIAPDGYARPRYNGVYGDRSILEPVGISRS